MASPSGSTTTRTRRSRPCDRISWLAAPVGRFPAAAELSFFHAEASGTRPDYLAAAVYAWIFLFPDGGARLPDPLDPRLRMAADLTIRASRSGSPRPTTL